MDHPILDAIRQRRSVRKYTAEPISVEELTAVLEAGRWAPSGLNNQPWRFVIVESQAKKDQLATYTRYGRVVRGAAVCVAVFMDKSKSYHQLKDAQGVGACLQNMLLAAHALGLGAVWLGEILAQADGVRECLGLDPGMELQAVVALGHPDPRPLTSDRLPLDQLIVARF